MSVSEDLANHAAECYPNECCGLVIGVGASARYVALENVSENPESSFLIAPSDFLKYESETSFVCHSHVDTSSKPSEPDIVCSERLGLPFIIVSTLSNEISCYTPSGVDIPLVGREFMHPICDCYALVKDYYRQELNIELVDYVRPAIGFWESAAAGDEFLKTIKDSGCVRVDDLRKGDIVAMQLQSKMANHLAVYTGDNVIIHQLSNSKSKREIYGSYWRKHTVGVFRHPDMPDK